MTTERYVHLLESQSRLLSFLWSWLKSLSNLLSGYYEIFYFENFWLKNRLFIFIFYNENSEISNRQII